MHSSNRGCDNTAIGTQTAALFVSTHTATLNLINSDLTFDDAEANSNVSNPAALTLAGGFQIDLL